jgi:signal transduction histidine kinase
VIAEADDKAPGRLSAALQWVQRLSPVGMALVLLWLTTAAVLLANRESRHDEALREAELFARVLEDHTRKALGSVDQALQMSGAQVLAVQAATPQADAETELARSCRRAKDDVLRSTVEQILQTPVGTQAMLRSLAWVDREGRVLASSTPDHCGLRLPLSRLRAASNTASTVSLLPGRDLADLATPSSAPATQQLLLRAWPMAAPRTTSGLADSSAEPGKSAHPGDKRQGGWLVAVANPGQLATQFELTVNDHRWRAVLAALDGTVIAASDAAAEALPQLAPGGQLRQSLRWSDVKEEVKVRDHGVVATPVWNRFGWHDRSASHDPAASAVTAYRAVRQYPLIVITDLPMQHLLAAAQTWERITLGVALVVSAVFLGLGWVVRRQRRASLESLRLEHETRRQLRDQFEQNEQLVDAMPVPVFLADLQGTLLVVNRAWIQWMELDLPRGGEADAERQERLQSLLAMGAEAVCRGESFRETLELPRQDDLPRETVLTKVPLRDVDGRVTGIIGTLIDITEYRQAERATERARRAAEELNQVRAEFVANVTHELRTPLQSIIGFAELGQTRSAEHAKLQLMFGRIHQSGGRMLRLVEDLLDITRIGSHVGAIHRRPADPTATVREVVEELYHLAEQTHQLELRLSIAPSLRGCVAEIDTMRIAQVVRNVVANALRFSPPSGLVQVSLTAESTAPDQQTFVCTVRDQGPGIPETELEAIFEPFVQSSRTKDGSGGTGLGLTISRAIMQTHGGSIRASNHPAGGAEVRIELQLSSWPNRVLASRPMAEAEGLPAG